MRGRYLALAAGLAVFMFIFYPWVQTLGLQTDLWYKVIPLLNLVMFAAFSVVFGAFVSFMIYSWRKGPKVCKINRKGTAAGAAATAASFFIGACPACFGFVSLVLPLGAATLLAQIGPAFMTLSIGLMLFSIQRNGGFRK